MTDPTSTPAATQKYVQEHGLSGLLGATPHPPPEDDGLSSSVDGSLAEALGPQWRDLVRLHHLIRTRRVTTVLEFGCGWSTAVMAHALQMNREDFGERVLDLRRNNAFELHLVDDMPDFVQVALSRCPPELLELIVPSVSPVNMTTFLGRICTEYQELPNIAPDFIYLDAPSQQAPTNSVDGITTDHPDRLPMSCDVLKIEHFLLPGTLLLVDGRTANARFLRANLQRDWLYRRDEAADVSTFELREPPLGRFNRRQIEFCLGKDWLDTIGQAERD